MFDEDTFYNRQNGARSATIYSERPSSATGGADKIYSGASIETHAEITAQSAPSGWTFTAQDTGIWGLAKNA